MTNRCRRQWARPPAWSRRALQILIDANRGDAEDSRIHACSLFGVKRSRLATVGQRDGHQHRDRERKMPGHGGSQAAGRQALGTVVQYFTLRRQFRSHCTCGRRPGKLCWNNRQARTRLAPCPAAHSRPHLKMKPKRRQGFRTEPIDGGSIMNLEKSLKHITIGVALGMHGLISMATSAARSMRSVTAPLWRTAGK